MTTFTPPTEFPHECLTVHGNDVVIFGVSTIKGPTQYVAEITDSLGTCAARLSPTDLRDLPKVTPTWQNVYPLGSTSEGHLSRSKADASAGFPRIAVLRRDTIDGVTTCTLEEI